MSAITEFEAAVNVHLDATDAKVDAAVASFTGIKDDVAFLKEEIAKLQGNGTAEDLAALNRVKARIEALATKTGAHADSLTALDAETTRPTPPPEG